MIITIEGKQGEGKTKLVKKIIGKSQWGQVTEKEVLSGKPFITEGVKYIVVDDVTDPHDLRYHFTTKKIRIRKPYSRQIEEVDMPHVILVSNSKPF